MGSESQYKPKLEQLAQRVASRFENVTILGIGYDLDHLSFIVHAAINGVRNGFPIPDTRVMDAFDGNDEAALERALDHAFRLRGARPRGDT